MRMMGVLAAACGAIAAQAACGGSFPAADATPGSDAAVDAGPVPCAAGVPGARIHLTFAGPPNNGSAYSWSGQPPEPALTMGTTGGGGTGCPITPDDVGPDGRATVACAYPPGTVAGPASVAFYAIAGGPTQWQSDQQAFTADPAACVDVDLLVRFLGGPDAGPDAAP
jgi:hypothetical protein